MMERHLGNGSSTAIWVHLKRWVFRRGLRGATAKLVAIVLASCLHQTAFASDFEFRGVVEARDKAVLSSATRGQLSEILFRGGETVEAGQPLMRLDARELELLVSSAEATLNAATAKAENVRRQAERLSELAEKRVATDASMEAAAANLATAIADVAIAEVRLEQARLERDKATIRAPISGVVGRPKVALGTFLEAKISPPLAEIIKLDPVLVAYTVPYETRLVTVRMMGAETIEDLFQNLKLTIRLQEGEVVADGLKPEFASATVDEATGTLTIWSEVPNPRHILRPGMNVTVSVEIVGAVPRK